MNYIDKFNNNIVKYDLFNKFNYNYSSNIPTLKKITLNFGINNSDLEKLISSALFLKLISDRKSSLTSSKISDIKLKIKKGYPVGCKVTLKKDKMFNFLLKFIIKIITKSKNFRKISLKTKNNSVSFTIKKTDLKTTELEYYYNILTNKITDLNINISTNAKTEKELLFLINSLKLSNFVRIG